MGLCTKERCAECPLDTEAQKLCVMLGPFIESIGATPPGDRWATFDDRLKVLLLNGMIGTLIATGDPVTAALLIGEMFAKALPSIRLEDPLGLAGDVEFLRDFAKTEGATRH
jgi:hypothetical protein